MTSPYQLIVFDWEGTVSDTLGVVLHTLALEAEHLGFGLVDPYRARNYVSLGLNQALKKLFPHLSLSQQEHLVQSVQRALLTKNTEVCLIPGAKEFIQQLDDANIHLAVATNKGHQSLQRALQATGLDAFFKVTRSAGQVPAKPCPQMLEEIISEFGVTPAQTLMIGDLPTDMEMAKSIQVTGLGVDFYHLNQDALRAAGAVEVFDDYQLLAQFVIR